METLRNEQSLKHEYKRLNPTGHWFDASTMRFFKSQIVKVRQTTNHWFFITSERAPSDIRKYSVRRMDALNGNVGTVGEFNSMTRSQAMTAMRHAIIREG